MEMESLLFHRAGVEGTTAMKRWGILLCVGCLTSVAVWICKKPDGPAAFDTVGSGEPIAFTSSPQELTPPPEFSSEIAPLLAKYCMSCHGSDTARGGVHFHIRPESATAQIELWEKVSNELRLSTMPPAGRPRPNEEESATLEVWLEYVLSGADNRAERKHVERMTVRRLNRTEYNNTVRDLLGVDLRLADAFPADDIGYGFDNIADVLSLPPLLIEKYLSAAHQAVEAAFASPDLRRRLLHPAPDGVPPAYRGFSTPARSEARKVLRKGPADSPPPPDPAGKQLVETANILRSFADRAYRRPITNDELTRLVQFVEAARGNGDDDERSMMLAMEAVLVSPSFLFRFELDNIASDTDAVRSLNDFELASRLSYFLWSSMPDEELFRLAAAGELRRPGVLEEQVRRMLGDDKARSLAANFGSQWLQVRGLADFHPDPARFPSFDESLRSAMLQETGLFFMAIIREERSVLEFLDADFTFVNERLARHYGVDGVTGSTFRRISLAGTQRSGILTQASVLAATSNPTRTSPVKRGKWILDNLLGAPPPAPPANVPDLAEDPHQKSESLRQRLERHRSQPACAACHARMDPLGFALENFDAVGAWRSQEEGHAVDVSGTFLGGQTFSGPTELRALLRTRCRAFVRCLTEKLFVYAMGRGLEPADRRVIDGIVRRLAADDYRFRALVQGIAMSEPFQMRSVNRGEP
jgi:cytochrome c553